MKTFVFLVSLGVLVASVSGMGLKPLAKKGTSQWGPLVYGFGLNNPNAVNSFRMNQALKVAKSVPGVYVKVEYDGDIELTDKYGREVDVVDKFGRELYDD